MHEAAHKIIDLYERHAHTWDRIRSRRLLEQSWLDRFRQAMPSADGNVLDIGCGGAEPMASYLIAAGQFFHLMPEDQRRMFPIFQAHAQHGAALMFTSGTAHGIALGSFEGETLYHASLNHDEYAALLKVHGFTVIEQVTEDPACGGHTIWLAVFD
jgi:hypothetical protein